MPRTPHPRTLPYALAMLAAAFAAPIALAQVAGDECTTAHIAREGLNIPVSTTALTASADPPANGPCAYLNWTATTKDAWWVYNAKGPGTLTINFCPSDYDTSVVVYQGACGALARIACDDDGCNPSGPIYQSRIDGVAVNAGPVYIRVGGYGGATGTVQFTLSFEGRGGLVLFGSNSEGQTTAPSSLGEIKSLACGEAHAIAQTASGAVLAWGRNTSGQCTVPAGVSGVRRVAAGSVNSAAILADGTVQCWGWANWGLPSVPADLGPVEDIAIGSAHAVALRRDLAVRSWGNNDFGQTTIPADLTRAGAIAAGFTHSAAIKLDGTVVCWGNNAQGQQAVPAGLGAVRSICAGRSFTACVTNSGRVQAWGQHFLPLGVPALDSGVNLVRCNSSAEGVAFVLLDDGTVYYQSFNNLAAPRALGAALEIDRGAQFGAAVSSRDCNGNSVVDVLEAASFDCDGSGIHDCWETTAGLLEDCNDNTLADECEKQLSIYSVKLFTPIGYGQPGQFEIPAAVPAVGTVTLVFLGHGDFGAHLEYLRIVMGPLFDNNIFRETIDCSPTTQEARFTVPAEVFNAAIGADRTWRLDVLPSIAVDAGLCDPPSRLTVLLLYTGAASSDCNANGLLDSCEIANGWAADTNGNGVPDSCDSALNSCPTDTDRDGQTGASDLSGLLSAWGSTNANFDFDGNGQVGASDLSQLLAAWGPCPSN
ncbi:MAG: hypothetical protein RLY21_2139 [Planctomycetota bacterium]